MGRDRRPGAFSHDVDYPEIITWIECLQLLRSRGLGGIPLARRVLRGETDFWRFQDWVDLAARYGTRNTFYFMAVRGSLVRYALGTPDAFYDIRSAAFRDLFKSLRDQGCEIGLHASFHAHRSADQLRREREILSEAAGVEVKDIDLLLIHQANLRIVEAVAKQLGLPAEKVPHNIERYGNTTAGTLPILYHECVTDGRIKPGMLICFTALGSGLHWGAALYRA